MLSFLAVGDWGRHGGPAQRAVADAMARVAATHGARFVVSTGDNFYEDGVLGLDDPHWWRSFEGVYRHPPLQVPWYVALGNHDYRGCPDAQVAYTHRSDRWRMPARHHAHTVRLDARTEALFVFLDTTPFLGCYHPGGSEPIPGAEEPDTSAQLAWLRRTLAGAEAAWKVVVGHHPILSGSPCHGGAEELDELVRPMLEGYGVQAYLCGHEHDLQHLAADGVHYFVTGAGSECRETGSLCETQFCHSSLGFLSARLTAATLTVRFHDAAGRTCYETHVRRTPRPVRLAASA